jgi:hypothetical protein
MKTANHHEQAQRPSSPPWPRALNAATWRAARPMLAVALVLAASHAGAAGETGDDPVPMRRYSVSSTWMTATNPLPNSASMYELHFGYRLTAKDTIALKACSWRLFAPMGIPVWDPHLQQASEFYPGKLHEFGLGLSYQRFLWRGLFASVQVVPLLKRYLDTDGRKVGDGFKLYTSYHLGYRFSFLRDRLYVEPQTHINYWPIDTKGPAGFEEKEARWSNNYLLFEPNLFIGVNL